MPHPISFVNVSSGLAACVLPRDSKRVERGRDVSSEPGVLARILVLSLRIFMLRMTLASWLLVARFLGVSRDVIVFRPRPRPRVLVGLRLRHVGQLLVVVCHLNPPPGFRSKERSTVAKNTVASEAW